MSNNLTVKDSGGNVVTMSSTDVGSGVEAMNHRVCDATAAHFLPSGDAAARTIYVTTNDGTNAITVKAASTGALAGDTALVVRPMCATDGTNTSPTMDAVARSGFQELTDGTNGPVAVKASSTRAATTDKALVVRPMMGTNGTQDMPTGDAIARTLYALINDGTSGITIKASGVGAASTDTALVTRPLTATDGTNTSPTMDAIARAGFQELTDGTTGPVAVKAASTAAGATDKALVVSLSPNSAAATNADGPVTAGTVASKSLLNGGQFLAWGSLPAATTAQQCAMQTDPAGTQKVGVIALGTALYATANGGAQANNVTLTIPSAKMGFLDGFDIDGLGATSGAAIAVTITGILGGTLTFSVPVIAGATTPNPSFSKRFNPPLQASAVNTNIVVNVPSFGAGNTAASVNAYGHYL